MRLAATSADSFRLAEALCPNACKLCARMFSLYVFRSTTILGALRAMHSEVLVTKNARINRNHQAL